MREYWTKAAGVKIIARAEGEKVWYAFQGPDPCTDCGGVIGLIGEEGILRIARQIKRLVNRVREAENLPGGRVSS